jgi:DNA-binding transcriptional LysR family regulator
MVRFLGLGGWWLRPRQCAPAVVIIYGPIENSLLRLLIQSRTVFDLLTYFLAVAETGGFTAASHRLGTTKAMVSGRVAQLETQLQTALFSRTTRRVMLTPAGERLFRQSAPLLAQLEEVLASTGREAGELHGLLRVTAGVDHLAGGLAQQLSRFAARHPALQLDVLATDEVVDLIGEGVDVAIRRGWLRDSALTATSLGTFEQLLVAAPSFNAPLRHPRELAELRTIALTRLRAPMTWSFSGPGGEAAVVRVKAAVTCNSPLGVLALARAGAGIAVLGAPAALEHLRTGELVNLLPRWKLPSAGIYAVFPASKHVPPRTRALVAFLKKES